MKLFKHGSYREQQLSEDLRRVRLELIEERRISEMLYGVILADPCECDVPEEESDYGILLYRAFSAYHRSRHKPITGYMEGN
jgi:hypothetical protein